MLFALILALLPAMLPLYVVRLHVGPLPTTALEILVWLFFGYWMLHRGRAGMREAWERSRGWHVSAIAWMAITFAAALWSPHAFAGLGLWRAYVLEPLLVFLVLHDLVRTAEDRRWLERGLWMLVFWVSAWAIVQFAFGIGIPHPWNVGVMHGRRATGPFPFPNAVALLLAPVGVYAWTVFFREASEDHRHRRMAFVASVCALIAIACAKSVGGFLGYAIGCAAILWGRFPQARSRYTVGTLMAAAVIFALPPLEHPLAKEMSFGNWSGQVRLITWRETARMLADHPLTGAGFGGYPTVFAAYHQAKAIEIFQFPHNILLNVWSETGMIGVIVFSWIIIVWITRARGSKLIALAPLAAILVHGLVDVPYFKNDLAILFWLLAFLATLDVSRSVHPQERRPVI